VRPPPGSKGRLLGDQVRCTRVCTVDLHKRDAELKLLWRCTTPEIATVEAFYAPLATISAKIIRR
jgi:hypothetical protein